jgi:hypothetical protein
VLNAVVDVLLMVASPQALQEIYIDKNKFHTKSETEKVRTGNLIKDSLILAESDAVNSFIWIFQVKNSVFSWGSQSYHAQPTT